MIKGERKNQGEEISTISYLSIPSPPSFPPFLAQAAYRSCRSWRISQRPAVCWFAFFFFLSFFPRSPHIDSHYAFFFAGGEGRGRGTGLFENAMTRLFSCLFFFFFLEDAEGSGRMSIVFFVCVCVSGGLCMQPFPIFLRILAALFPGFIFPPPNCLPPSLPRIPLLVSLAVSVFGEGPGEKGNGNRKKKTDGDDVFDKQNPLTMTLPRGFFFSPGLAIPPPARFFLRLRCPSCFFSVLYPFSRSAFFYSSLRPYLPSPPSPPPIPRGISLSLFTLPHIRNLR